MYDDEAVIMNLKELPDMDESPGMFYFHLVSTHEIGVIKPENELFKPFSRDMSAHAGFEKNELSDNDKQRLINGYDNGIFQLDKYIRDIFLVLKEKGYLEDAIVIITSDHGDGIGERGYYYHTYQLYQEDISIPLLVYDTSNRCQLVNTRYGTHIDIAPTVLDCLGLPMVSTWQGRSLLKQPAKNRFTFHQTIRNKEEFALIKEDGEHMYKLMASRVRNELYNLRLFEIYSDPHEKNDLMKSADSELVNEMMTVLNLKIQK
jgi:arylsulfatase A-like enzyme